MEAMFKGKIFKDLASSHHHPWLHLPAVFCLDPRDSHFRTREEKVLLGQIDLQDGPRSGGRLRRVVTRPKILSGVLQRWDSTS